MVKVDKEKIAEIVERYFILDSFTIDDKGFVSVNGDCSSRPKMRQSKLPVNFKMVTGTFSINHAKVTTLQRSPKSCRVYQCSNIQLKSLEGAPNVVDKLVCVDVGIRSYKGGPSQVKHLNIIDNPLTTLEHIPPCYIHLTYDKDLPLLRLLRFHYFNLYGGGDSEAAMRILERYHNDVDTTRSDILACQKELIDNGFEGNARW